MTAADIREFAPQAFRLVAAGSPPVHFIVDTGTLLKVEDTFGALKAVQFTKAHPDTGWMVVTGHLSSTLRFLADLTAKLTSVRYQHCETRAQAIAFLKAQDETLLIR